MGKSIWDVVVPLALGAATGGLGLGPALGLSTAAGAAIGSGVGSGITTGVETGNPIAGLASGIGGGLGSYAGNAILGPELSSLGGSTDPASGAAKPGFLGKTFGDTFGNFAGNAIGNQTLGSLAGGAIGSSVGSSVGGDLGQQLNPQSSPPVGGPAAFSPTQQPSLGLPQSLSQLSGLDPLQQTTNIASKGVYGGGNGPQETNYFLNQVNRQLFDQSGNVSGNNNLPPVDLSYLNQLGISGSSPNDILQGISKYGT